MITDSQVGIPRASALRRTETKKAPRLIGLITDHFVAKLIALLFAAVLIALIDRELETTLLDAEFDVRVGEPSQASLASPGRRQIVLDTEPGVAVRFIKPLQVRVIVKGQQKLADQFKTKSIVGSVLIKASWLKGDSEGTRLSISRTIEGADVQIGGARGATITLDPPIQVDLDPEVVREVPLRGSPKDVAPGWIADVTFEPATVRVLGPESLFQGIGAIDQITIPIHTGGKTQEETQPITSLPDEVLQKQIRMAPDQQVLARMRFTKGEPARLDVKDVPLGFFRPAESPYKLAFVGLSRNVVTVTLTGSPQAVAYWKEHLDELKRQLRAVVVDTEDLVNRANPQPGSPASEYAEVQVIQIPENLKRESVTPAQVEVSVKRE